MIAQSVHGGGGLVMNGSTMVLQGANGGGSSGLVTVNVAPNVKITTTGAGSTAILMTSTTDPILNVGAGASIIGGAGGAAVVFDSPINELNNSGSLATLDGATGMAVQSLSGDTTVKNSGTLLGKMQLAAGATNLVHNQSTGTILAGPSLDLGGGTLQNDGTLRSGGATTGATTINGSMTQSATGVLLVRFDHKAGTADAFNVTGPAQSRRRAAADDAQRLADRARHDDRWPGSSAPVPG